jgi:lipoprotein signal peptidase
MSRWRNCGCAYCRTRGLMGPAILITIGVLFFIGQYSWQYSFDRTWPIIVIVFGAVKLISDMASTEGHIDASAQWQTPPIQQPPPPPPPSSPPPIR